MECDWKKEFWLVIGFIEHLQIVTTNNYSAIVNSRTLQFNAARTVAAWWRILTMSSVSVFTLLSADDCRTTHSLLQLPDSKVSCHLTLISSSSYSLTKKSIQN
jgi:hypothetical protein